jgi:hypothetical protein
MFRSFLDRPQAIKIVSKAVLTNTSVRPPVLDPISLILCNSSNNDWIKNELYSVYAVVSLEHRKDCEVPVC